MSIEPFSVEKIWVPTDFTEFGKPKENLVNVAGCENSHTSGIVMKVLQESLGSNPALLIDHWQSQDTTLRKKLAELHDVALEQVYLTAGALAGIQYSFGIFVNENTNVGLLKPDFPGFVYFSKWKKANTHWLKNTEFPFYIGNRDIADFVRKNIVDFLILSNPSAVMGTQKETKEIEDLVKASPNTIFIVDEADSIHPDSSSAHLSKSYNNAIFLGSFSKFYGLSGLRGGYLITPKKFSEHFDRTISPAELTSLAILAATHVLDDKQYQRETQEKVRKNLSSLESACEGIPYRVVPGSRCFASYLWADGGVEDPYQTLQGYGIKILKGSNFGIERGGRVNLSSTENIGKLTGAVKQIFPTR